MISLLRRETCIRIGLLKHPQAMEGFWGVTGLSKKIFALAIERLALDKSEILTIGDNLKTDIHGSNSAGIKSALVLTGKTTMTMAKKSKIKPDYIIKNLKI